MVWRFYGTHSLTDAMPSALNSHEASIALRPLCECELFASWQLYQLTRSQPPDAAAVAIAYWWTRISREKRHILKGLGSHNVVLSEI